MNADIDDLGNIVLGIPTSFSNTINGNDFILSINTTPKAFGNTTFSATLSVDFNDTTGYMINGGNCTYYGTSDVIDLTVSVTGEFKIDL